MVVFKMWGEEGEMDREGAGWIKHPFHGLHPDLNNAFMYSVDNIY